MVFSFVDRITQFQSGRGARGLLGMPEWAVEMPPALVAEAVGQLAAWVAMEKVDFKSRPVAALAQKVTMGGAAIKPMAAELEVKIESLEDDAIAYGGLARDGDTELVRLTGCVAPMLAMEEFDDPAALRRRFDALNSGQGGQASVDRSALAPLSFSAVISDDNQRARASITVPKAAPFFADHFPRKPVLPATLLLDAQIRLGLELKSHTLALAPKHARISVGDVKVRAFVLPGEALDLEAAIKSPESSTVTLSARRDGKLLSSATLSILPGAST